MPLSLPDWDKRHDWFFGAVVGTTSLLLTLAAIFWLDQSDKILESIKTTDRKVDETFVTVDKTRQDVQMLRGAAGNPDDARMAAPLPGSTVSAPPPEPARPAAIPTPAPDILPPTPGPAPSAVRPASPPSVALLPPSNTIPKKDAAGGAEKTAPLDQTRATPPAPASLPPAVTPPRVILHNAGPAVLEGYFASEAKRRTALAARYPGLRANIQSVKTNIIGNSVAACSFEAEVLSDSGKTILYRRGFSGEAAQNDDDLLARACRDAVDKIFQQWELS